MTRLTGDVYARGASALARRLLGTVVACQAEGVVARGRIVETEAYVGARDRASHAFGGRRTPRNESMYLAAGRAYVYISHGVHRCFNVVCAREGVPEAVLIRALEPIAGLEAMRGRRGPEVELERLCRGPGNLCRALGIHMGMDGADLVVGDEVWIEDGRLPGGSEIARTARVGMGENCGVWRDRPYRYLVRHNRFVSGPRGSPTVKREVH